MSRWNETETAAIEYMRSQCQQQMDEVLPFPEVVGDRRLLRFLRGRLGNVEEAIVAYNAFLTWRKVNCVDKIRNDIVYNNFNHPFKFPNGKKIIELQPQIVIAPNARDKYGQPIVLEIFGAYPANKILESVTLEEYMQFLIYTLEYRACILEQLSEAEERKILDMYPDPETRPDAYGKVLKTCTIRDLKGVGVSHLGAKTKSVIQAGLTIAIPNYPEFLGKSYFINVPTIFTMLWYFIKGMLDANTLTKISLNGSNYLSLIRDEIPHDSIPAEIGGGFVGANLEFDFDISPQGPLYYPGAPLQKARRLTCTGYEVGSMSHRSSFSKSRSSSYDYLAAITPRHSISGNNIDQYAYNIIDTPSYCRMNDINYIINSEIPSPSLNRSPYVTQVASQKVDKMKSIKKDVRTPYVEWVLHSFLSVLRSHPLPSATLLLIFTELLYLHPTVASMLVYPVVIYSIISSV